MPDYRDATAYAPTPGPRGCVSEPDLGTPVTRGAPRHGLGRPHPDRGPGETPPYGAGRACRMRCLPPGADGPRTTRPAATTSTQGKNGRGPRAQRRGPAAPGAAACLQAHTRWSIGPVHYKTGAAQRGPGPARASRPPADTTRVPACRRAPPRAPYTLSRSAAPHRG